MNNPDFDRDDLSKESILELFYRTKGKLDDINREIDSKLKIRGLRKITLFEEFVKNRLNLNPLVLKMPQMEVSSIEAVYLSQYSPINGIKILDLRKNFIGDQGLEAISQSPFFKELQELDLRSNGITRLGMKSFGQSKNFEFLVKVDLRSNKLGKRWEEKIKESGNFPNLTDVKTM